jgi:hypothetical protein
MRRPHQPPETDDSMPPGSRRNRGQSMSVPATALPHHLGDGDCGTQFSSEGSTVPLSVTCTVPKERLPTFPDRCAVCLKQQPGATTRVAAKGPSRSLVRGWFSVQVPACPGCGSRLRWQAARRFLRTVLVASVAMLDGLGKNVKL